MRTVSQVARLAGVTVRTLHHYDEMGLLSPSARTAAGYRLYDRGDLERLQEILFWRELGFTLDEIRALVDDPGHDRGASLRRQLALLRERSEELAAMAEAVASALKAHEEARTVDFKEMFDGFDPADYEAEVQERWGATDAYQESKRRTDSYGEAEWLQIRDEGAQINHDFVALMQAGVAADSPEAAAVAEAHRQYLSRWFYACAPEMHRELGKMYVADARFTANIDKAAAGLAVYMRDAIAANAAA